LRHVHRRTNQHAAGGASLNSYAAVEKNSEKSAHLESFCENFLTE
jgi:hypothetical protein